MTSSWRNIQANAGPGTNGSQARHLHLSCTVLECSGLYCDIFVLYCWLYSFKDLQKVSFSLYHSSSSRLCCALGWMAATWSLAQWRKAMTWWKRWRPSARTAARFVTAHHTYSTAHHWNFVVDKWICEPLSHLLSFCRPGQAWSSQIAASCNKRAWPLFSPLDTSSIPSLYIIASFAPAAIR